MEAIHPNLVWIDLEMTGLGDEHVILEIATIIKTNVNIFR